MRCSKPDRGPRTDRANEIWVTRGPGGPFGERAHLKAVLGEFHSSPYCMGMRIRLITALLCTGLLSSVAHAKPNAKEDAEFTKRLAALTKRHGQAIAIKMKPTDDPAVLPATAGMPSGLVMVAGGRNDIFTPSLITPEDITVVIQQHMVDVRTCYKKQLEADPEWADRLILDMSIKKTGRISEVSIAPRRVKRAAIGKCLMSRVPNWKFPEFTGETDDGITQEVVNASFPFAFSVN